MAKKISELPDLPTQGTGSEIVPVDQGGVTYKSTLNMLLGWLKSPITSLGDLFVGGAGGSNARLPIGTTNQVLTVVSGAPAWAAAPLEIPAQSGNNGKYLTTNGTIVSWATVASGGLVNFSESLNTTGQNATINIAALSVSTGATDTGIALISKGNGGLSVAIPDGFPAGGNVRGTGAVDFQRQRFVNTQVASGSYSFIGGGSQNTAGGAQAATLGGSANNITGQNSIGVGGSNNAVSGVNSGVVACTNATITTTGTVAIASRNVSAYNTYSVVRSSGKFSVDGDAQTESMVHMASTTDATPTDMQFGSTGTVFTPGSATFGVVATVVARDSSGTDCAMFTIKFLINNIASGLTASLKGIPSIVQDTFTPGASSWTAVPRVPGGSNTFMISVTGAAGVNIKWVASIKIIEAIG